MSLKLLLLLELQRKYNISFKQMSANTVAVTIGKWDQLKPFMMHIIDDAKETDYVKLLAIDEASSTITIQYDEHFFVKESGWKIWMDKYEKQLHTYVYG